MGLQTTLPVTNCTKKHIAKYMQLGLGLSAQLKSRISALNSILKTQEACSGANFSPYGSSTLSYLFPFSPQCILSASFRRGSICFTLFAVTSDCLLTSQVEISFQTYPHHQFTVTFEGCNVRHTIPDTFSDPAGSGPEFGAGNSVRTMLSYGI